MPITIDGSGTVTGISAGGLPDGCIVNDDLAGGITDSKLTGITCKAWVNFNGTSNTANLSGTYSQSGTTVTVTATAHGLIEGNVIYADATSGTAVDGIYTVATVTGVDTFTYTAGTSLTTSGNITIRRNTIRASYNVSSITDNGTGDYTVNFTTAMSDANYCVATTAMVVADQGSSYQFGIRTTTSPGTAATTKTTSALRLLSRREADNDLNDCNVAIFR